MTNDKFLPNAFADTVTRNHVICHWSVTWYPGKLPVVPMNQIQIQQVIVTAIRNGIEAGCRRIEIDASAGEGILRLRVKDDGCGMSEVDVERAFDPYFTRGKSAGLGLGLSIAHGIASSHDGSIELLSEEGVGTQLILELPLAERARQPAAGV